MSNYLTMEKPLIYVMPSQRVKIKFTENLTILHCLRAHPNFCRLVIWHSPPDLPITLYLFDTLNFVRRFSMGPLFRVDYGLYGRNKY